MEQRPEVRLVDPGAAPGAFGDADGRYLGGRRAGVVVLLVVAALVAGVAVWHPWRRFGVVRLRVDGTAAVYLGVSAGRAGRPTHLQVPVRLQNDGPRPVEVLSATVTGTALRAAPGLRVLVPRGGSAQVLLEQDVSCRLGRDPDVPRAGSVLVVRLAASTERLVLPAEPVRSVAVELRQLCGYVPAGESVRVQAGAGRLTGRTVLVPVQVSNVSAQWTRVTAVTGAVAGLTVAVEDAGGRALPLPVGLPVPPGAWPRTPRQAQVGTALGLAIRLDEAACPAFRAAPRPAAPGTPGVLALLRVDHGPGTPSSQVHPVDAGLALPLLAVLC